MKPTSDSSPSRSAAKVVLPKRRIDPSGTVRTPGPLAEWISRRALALWREGQEGRDTQRAPAILDPGVGDGVFLQAMISVFRENGAPSAATLFGMDIRPEAVRRARRSVPEATITTGNFLLASPRGPDRYDIIVGNPPYVGQRDVLRLQDADALVERYGTKDDLYVYFLRRSLELLAEGGVLAMVTSDSWLTLSGKEPLRRELLRHRLDHIVRLPDSTFGRRIPTCSFALTRGAAPGRIRWYRRSASFSNAGAFDPGSSTTIAQSHFVNAPRSMLFEPTPENRATQRRQGKRLKRWLAGAFEDREIEGPWSPGDVVPLHAIARVSDVGIHSRNCRHRLFHKTRTRPGLSRLLQGRQIERWRVRWNAPTARYRWVDLDYKPKPGVKGIGRSGTPSRRDEYWDFQGDPAIHRLPERVLIRQTGDGIVAALLRQSNVAHYTDNTLFTCLLNQRGESWGLTHPYVLAFLNSAQASRVYRFLSQERQRRQAQLKIALLRVLPFRLPSLDEVHEIGGIVEEILRSAKTNRFQRVAELSRRCDAHFRSAS